MNLHSVLDHGVANGVISATQRDALLALGGADASVAERREAPRDFNGVMIAYGIGALVVIFAFAWFMVDRWRVLGDSGIFGLSIAYASVFLFVAHMLHREGFETARGVAMFLAIGMAPLAMRSLLRWTGLWTPELDLLCGMTEHPFAACQGDPMAIELSTVVAALLAIRAMAFAPFMIPIAIICVTFPERMLREWNPGMDMDGAVMGWRYAIVASVLAAVAYTMDRRRKTEDYGAFLWVAVAILTFSAGVLLFQTDHSLRPWLAPTALLMITASLYLRRRVLLIIGLMGLLGFLAWLAFDVFKLTTGFPLVLAVLGVAIIILTVWVQKRFPEFIQRLGGDPNQPPHFPGGIAALLVPALLGLLLTENAVSIDKESMADRRSRSHANASRYRARRDSIAGERARKAQAQPQPQR